MRKYLPYALSLMIIALDQITKAAIVALVPEGSVACRLLWDFLWIVHVRNDAVAFSMGTGFPFALKLVLFIFVPVALMALLAYIIASGKGGFTRFQVWCLAGILGGGTGNLIDRILRSLRVVDWISTNNYGFMGMDRFPTYNIADASVVISVILLAISFIAEDIKGRKNGKER
ncbi:MAG: signal peptidase II [Candidatus Ornithospirochaeta sp.]|nr:signal peptidase II [Candidatus Ornithospirochaeta sp.]